MYRNNKANLWLRTICVTVALLGMLFFTHSQFSSAATPTAISVDITTTATAPYRVNSVINIMSDITPAGSETIMGDVTLTFFIGIHKKTVTLTTSSSAAPYRFTGSYTVVAGDNGGIAFTSINFTTSGQAAAGYDGTNPSFNVGFNDGFPSGIVKTVADPATLSVAISATGDDTTVTDGEMVKVVVDVVDGTRGALDSTTGVPTVQYKIADGASTNLTLMEIVANPVVSGTTQWSGTVDVVSKTTAAGAFTFESTTLNLENTINDVQEQKAYAEADLTTFTDAGLTIYPVKLVDPPTAVDLDITAANTTVGINDTVTFAATITDLTNGIAGNVTVNYQINGNAYKGSIDLAKQTGGLWSTSLAITENTTSGDLSFVSLVVDLSSSDYSENVSKTYDASAAMITEKLNIAIDVSAPVDPPTANKTTTSAAATTSASSLSSSSSESMAGSPVSIFAVFILIASVSMAVGVYTLRRRR